MKRNDEVRMTNGSVLSFDIRNSNFVIHLDLWQFSSNGRIVSVKVLFDSTLALEKTIIISGARSESKSRG